MAEFLIGAGIGLFFIGLITLTYWVFFIAVTLLALGTVLNALQD